MKKFKPKICKGCTQTENYILSLDKGSARIVRALLEHISKKGINEVHPTQEMSFMGTEKWFITNLSRPRFHGLIAYVNKTNKPGYYCLTRKAGKFFKNEPIPKHAVISKVTGHQEGYWMEKEEQTTMRELLGSTLLWNGEQEKMINYLYKDLNQLQKLF